ncbi:AraC family transcriptional regulator [Reyranella sp.]|uniref:helix-turn-helix transcriptional regulator n=1 Tax=Reyranella sp. TaxID=1929291 RepID=UPI003BAB2BF8
MSIFIRNEVRGGVARPSGNARMFQLTEAFRFDHAKHGKMVEDIATIGNLEVARVRSTGHFISLREAEKLTVLLPISGQLEVETSKRSWVAEPQAGLLFAPNRRATRARSAHGAHFEANVLLLPEFVVREEVRRAGMRVVRPDIECHFESTQPSQGFPSLQRYLGYLIQELSRPGSLLAQPRVQHIASGLALEQLIAVLKDCGALSDGNSSPFSSLRQVKAAESYIREHYATIGSMNEVAQAVGVGLRSLQVSFQSAIGMTPRERLMQVRLDHARQALLRSEAGITVASVAMQVGFTHLGRFSTLYRRVFDESPSTSLKRSLTR